MAATDHPIVLDLGRVRGLVVTNGQPSDSDGSDGEVRIDPENGNVWERTDGTWVLICQLALASTVPEEQIQSNWTQSDATKKDFIKNKPTISNTIASGGTNLAPSGAIYNAIQSMSTPLNPVQTTLSMGGTGTFDGGHVVEKYGKIVFVTLASYNQTESVWKRSITIGNKGTGTAICTVPEGYGLWARTTEYGFVYTASNIYNARFTLYSPYDTTAPRQLFVAKIYDGDWNEMSTSQITATGFSVAFVGHVGNG